MPKNGGSVDVEARLAANTVRRAVFVGPVAVGLAWLVAGTPGLVAAAVGVGIVVANFLAAGWLLATAARLSLAAYHAAALFGFFVRFGLLAVVMLLVIRFVELERTVFAIVTIGTYLTLLAWEASAVARGRERDLEWTN